MAFFSGIVAKKVSLKKKSMYFRSKWCINVLKKSFPFWQNVFLKTGCASPATELLEFFEETERDFLKQKHKRSLMFWGAIRSDCRKLLVKCPNKLNAVGYVEILKNDKENMHFLDIILQQDDAPVHKSKIIGNFFQEN